MYNEIVFYIIKKKKNDQRETYFESSIVGHSMVNPEHSGRDIVANHNINSVMSSW